MASEVAVLSRKVDSAYWAVLCLIIVASSIALPRIGYSDIFLSTNNLDSSTQAKRILQVPFSGYWKNTQGTSALADEIDMTADPTGNGILSNPPANSTYVEITGRLAVLFGGTAKYYLIDELGSIELVIDSGAGNLYRYEGTTIEASGYLVSQDDQRILYVENLAFLEATPAISSVSGPQSAIAILVEFSDNTASHTVNYFQQLIFSQMNAYYVEVSYNSIQITGGTTSQWYKLSHPTTYYQVHNWMSPWLEYRKLASDVIALVDPFVNFASYQHYIMVFAGDWVWGARCGGLWIFTNDGVIVNSVTFQRETYGMTVFAHEFGHDLGLPDLYDYDSHDPYDFVDGWDLMSVDNAQHLSSWSKIDLSWIPTSRIKTFTSGTVTATIERIEYSTSGYQALKVLTATNVYFLVETRQKVGYDINLPSNAPDHGVLITKIDETKASGYGIVRLVDANPSTQSAWDGDAVWQVGQTYIDATYGFSVSIQSWTGTGFIIAVSSFNFSLSNSGGITVMQGSSGSNTISVTLVFGASQSVSLSASGLPSGASASFNPTSGNPTFTSTCTISTSSSTPTGSYTITVTGTGGGLARTTAFTLTVNPQTYTVTFYTDPTSGTITAGSVTKSNGATGTYSAGQRVHVTANPPTGYSFSSWEVSGVSIDSTSSQDTYMTVSNNGWLKAHFNVVQAKPSLIITLTDASFSRGQVATITVTIFNPTSTSLASALYIEVSGLGSYYYFDFSQVSVAANSFASYSFTWQVPSDAAIGTYQISTGLVPPILTAYDVKYVGVT